MYQIQQCFLGGPSLRRMPHRGAVALFLRCREGLRVDTSHLHTALSQWNFEGDHGSASLWAFFFFFFLPGPSLALSEVAPAFGVAAVSSSRGLLPLPFLASSPAITSAATPAVCGTGSAVACVAAPPVVTGAVSVAVFSCGGVAFGITILGSDRTARYVRRVSVSRISTMQA